MSDVFSKRLVDRLRLALSGMPHATDEAMWDYIVKERAECLKEIERLNKSRNKWGQKYNNLLIKMRQQ